jgi:hypothetical protein
MSTEAQDDGVFTDEAGVKAWLAENQDTLVEEATRRHAEAQAKWLKDKAEKAAAQAEGAPEGREGSSAGTAGHQLVESRHGERPARRNG